jgi:hypothetical protein
MENLRMRRIFVDESAGAEHVLACMIMALTDVGLFFKVRRRRSGLGWVIDITHTENQVEDK